MVSGARVAALIVIAVVVLGLAYLSLAPGGGSVRVPAGARAGQLILKPCTYATENGSYKADCGTLVVAENRADPRSRLIALPVTRIRARSAHPAEPIFYLEGGPGGTNMEFADASRVAADHDVVLVGYRGVDGSSVLACPEVTSALEGSADFLGRASEIAYANAFRACATRLQRHGVDLAGYTLPEQGDDLEAARVALGYGRVDLLSESAGTRLAMIYAWRYPRSVYRSVMIGVNPPGGFVSDPAITDQQLRHYAALCAQDAKCRARTADLAATLRRVASHMPDRWLFLPIKNGNVRLGTFIGLQNAISAAAPVSAPITLDAWLSAAHGDPSGLWFGSLLSDMKFPKSSVWGEFAAVTRIDARYARQYFASGAGRSSILGNPGTEFLWAGGRALDAWPSNPSDHQYGHVQTSTVPTLLIGGTVDFATPPQLATQQLLPHLRNGHQVILAELGHVPDFWSFEPAAANRLLNTFFATGKVDASQYTHRTMNFAAVPPLPTLAKAILATTVTFAMLTLLVLLWMARRVHKRGSVGRKTSGWIRTLSPLLLGLDGWFLAALIGLTVWPTLSLSNDLLAIVGVGAPTALGLYYAWVHRDWPRATKRTGLLAATGGALLGGWFGFTSTTGLLALITTPIGAAAIANLALIVLDISRERTARRPLVTPRPTPRGPLSRILPRRNAAAGS